MTQSLKIYMPLKTNRLTQTFGKNAACVFIDNRGSILKVVGKRNGKCPDGYLSFYDEFLGMKGHSGYDYIAWNGEPLYFSAEAKTKDGTDVRWYARSEVDRAGGIGVDVFSLDPIFLKELPKEAGLLARREWQKSGGWIYLKFRFWHLKDTPIESVFKPLINGVRDFQWIKTGDFIGRADSTGASSGHHLHFSCKIISTPPPAMTLDGNNGYFGGVSFPEGSFENHFIGEVQEIIKYGLTVVELAKIVIIQVQIFLQKRLKEIGGLVKNLSTKRS